MDAIEATKLLAHAAAFDNRKPSKAASIAWAEALKDIPADSDAFAAVAKFYSQPSRDGDLDSTRWIQPHHVRTLRKEIRDERIPDGAFTYPLPAGSETGAEFVARRRQQIAAIADGRLEAEPIRQLTGGPHPSVADALTGVGRMPEHVREALADALPGRKAREEARLRGDADALAVPCPWCQAAAGDPCKRRRGARGDKPGTWFHRTTAHPGRVDAAAIAARACPSCQAPMGVPCMRPDGRPYDGAHPGRLNALPAA
ncbi:zinc finger domain-containing protein [Kitasatospora sp. NPDC001132]